MLHAAVIMEPGTSQSRGFGFVHFPDAATASMAAQAMNRKQVRRHRLPSRGGRHGPIKPLRTL